MLNTDIRPGRGDHEGFRPRDSWDDADRAPAKPADESERLVDTICAMMAERSSAGA